MNIRSTKIIVIPAIAFIVISVAVQVQNSVADFLLEKKKLNPVQAVSEQIPIISVDFSKEGTSIDKRVFGEGVEMPFLDNIWNKDGGFDQEALNVTKAINFTNIRFGGATCRTYNWQNGAMEGYRPYKKTYWEGIDEWVRYTQLLNLPSPTVCTNIHLSPQVSAEWVRYANIEKNYNITNWEMGNEEYLAYNNVKDYVRDAKAHCQAMKAVDPRIKCGIVGDQKSVSWNDAALISLLKPGDFDFYIAHFYQPEGYFNYYSMYMNSDKFQQQLNFKPGKYKFNFYAVGDQAPETKDPIPTMRFCVDNDCSLIGVTNTERGKWEKYTTKEYGISGGSHKVSFNLINDYYGWTSHQDKNIFAANLKMIDENSNETDLNFIDTKKWTYSFLASNLTVEDSIKHLKQLISQQGLSMPIYITEYGWSYGLEAFPNWGLQFDWRSTLFDVLNIQSLIKESIPQANIWNDLSTGYWKYFSNDEKGKNYWPIFSAFKLLSEKTGDRLVETKIENVPTYDAQKFQTTDRANIPYLSIISSKKDDKNYINVVNRSQDNPILATIKTNIDYTSVKISEIAPSSIESHPYRDDKYKEEINAEEKTLAVSGPFNYKFKPFSVTTFEFNITAPIISSGLPEGTLFLGKGQTKLQVKTDKPASCRFDLNPELNYAEMADHPFATSDGINHTAEIHDLKNGRGYAYYVKCQNMAGSSNAVGYKVSFNTAKAASPNFCTVYPEAGHYFKPTNITIVCGSNVTKASYQWDKGPVTGFALGTTTKYYASKKQALIIKYDFKAVEGKKRIQKTVALNKVFDVNQTYCNVVPDGGVFMANTNVHIECGKSVKRSTWRWDNGSAYNFNPSTDINFIADKSKNLNISFAYDLPSKTKVEEKVIKFSKTFKVVPCLDSDQGLDYQQKGLLVYTGSTIKRNYEDSCSNNILTEYYCRGGNMAYVKIRCSGSCIDGRCIK